jgi:hypothetical protein
VTTLLPSPFSQQNQKERRRSPFPCSKAIKEGGGSCRLLLLQYKVVVVVAFFFLLQKKEKKEGACSHLLCYATRRKKKKATVALLPLPSLLRYNAVKKNEKGDDIVATIAIFFAH